MGHLNGSIFNIQVKRRNVNFARSQLQRFSDVIASRLVLQLIFSHDERLPILQLNPQQLLSAGINPAHLVIDRLDPQQLDERLCHARDIRPSRPFNGIEARQKIEVMANNLRSPVEHRRAHADIGCLAGTNLR